MSLIMRTRTSLAFPSKIRHDTKYTQYQLRSELLTANRKIPGSIPVLVWIFFVEGNIPKVTIVWAV